MIYRHLFFGQSRGVAAYIPGVSKVNPHIIPYQWVVRLENGRCVFMYYNDDQEEFAHRRIVFVARGENDSELSPDEEF